MCHVFPPLVSIFGLFPVLVKCDHYLILVQLCLSSYLWYSLVFKSCLFSLISSCLLVTPRCFCESALPCLALMASLKTIIWVYSSSPCSSFLPAVTEDQTKTVSGAPSHRFFFRFSKVFCFVPRGMEVTTRPPALARGWCVGVRRDRRESAGREHPARRSREFTPPSAALPGPPFAGVSGGSRSLYRTGVEDQSGLVLSAETRRGQAAPLVMAEEAIPSRLPLLLQKWKRFLRQPCEGPWLHFMPRMDLSFRARPRRASCSYGVSCSSMDCPVPVCLAPEGSWYPLAAPWKFFWG